MCTNKSSKYLLWLRMAGMESNSIFIVIIFIKKENALNYRQFFVVQCYENKRD